MEELNQIWTRSQELLGLVVREHSLEAAGSIAVSLLILCWRKLRRRLPHCQSEPVGEFVRKKREHLGKSIPEVAVRIDLRPDEYLQFEEGKRTLTSSQLDSLAKCLGIGLEWLHKAHYETARVIDGAHKIISSVDDTRQAEDLTSYQRLWQLRLMVDILARQENRRRAQRTQSR